MCGLEHFRLEQKIMEFMLDLMGNGQNQGEECNGVKEKMNGHGPANSEPIQIIVENL